MNTSENLTREDKEFKDMVVARLTGNVFFKWKAQLDETTCTECARQHGRVFHIKEIKRAYIKPPFCCCHTNCRCTLVPYKDFA